MSQLSLFDAPPAVSTKGLVHRDDPASSRIAAERHVESGKSQRHRDLILAVLQRQARIGGEPLTGAEIAVSIDWGEPLDVHKHAQEVRRRLTELQRDGLAISSGDKCRKCEVLFSKAMVWSLKR